MLQKELAKRLRARYDTKMDGNEWLERQLDKLQEKLTDGYPSLEAEPPTFEQVSPPQQNM